MKISDFLSPLFKVIPMNMKIGTPRYQKPRPLCHPDEKLLLYNLSIVDVEKGQIAKANSLLIQGGKITLLPKGNKKPEADVAVDLGGAYVMPGLINAHCHMTLPCGLALGPIPLMTYMRQVERNAEECIKHGVTTVRDMLAMSDWLVRLKEKISRGDVIGPRILTSCALDVAGGYGHDMAILPDSRFIKTADTPATAKEAVSRAFDEGADLIKIFQQPVSLMLPGKPLPTMDVPTLAAVRNEAARRNMTIGMHHTKLSGLQKGIEAEVPCFDHLARDYEVPDAEISKMVDLGAYVIPTITASFGLSQYRQGDPFWNTPLMQEVEELRSEMLPAMMKEYCEPAFVGPTLKMYARYRDPKSYEKWHLMPWPDQKHFTSAIALGSQNAKKYYEAGVKLGAGNDGGIPFVYPGSMGLELYMMERAGIKTADVLKAATAGNAAILGLENELGTIAKGKIADLAVFAVNPLETAENTCSPTMVFKSGELVFKKG